MRLEGVRCSWSTKQAWYPHAIYTTNHAGDGLLLAEWSRLGRTMFEATPLLNQWSANRVKIIFVRQPALPTTRSHGKLLLAIYSYFAGAEHAFISLRTQQGLAAARASGKKRGRPKGSRDKARVLDPYR